MNDPIPPDTRTLPPRAPAEPEASARAIAALVFGILGIAGVLPCVGPILGLVLGHNERSGVGRAGVVLSWVALALYVLIGCLVLGAIAFAVLVEAVR